MESIKVLPPILILMHSTVLAVPIMDDIREEIRYEPNLNSLDRIINRSSRNVMELGSYSPLNKERFKKDVSSLSQDGLQEEFPARERRSFYGGYPSTYGGYPSTYGGYPSTYGSYPSTYGSYPSTYGGNPSTYGSYPSTYGGNPSTYGGYPSTYGGNPSTYGGNPSTYGGYPVGAGARYPSYGRYPGYGYPYPGGLLGPPGISSSALLPQKADDFFRAYSTSIQAYLQNYQQVLQQLVQQEQQNAGLINTQSQGSILGPNYGLGPLTAG